MYDTVCTLPLSSELFTQALHPTDTVLAVGLASGHVQTFRLPATGHGGRDDDEVNSGFGKVETQWRTRRHQGSCRSLTFSPDGEVLFSAGTDGILKAASSRTGQVSSKIAIPTSSSAQRSSVDVPTHIHALSAQTLLVATESSALHVYDLRQQSFTSSASTSSAPNFSVRQKPQQTYHPHDDYVSSITALPPPGHASTASRSASGTGAGTSSNSSTKQFITTGATTLAVTDLRRGVLSRSEDQEEELLSSVLVTGLPARRSHGSNGKGGGGGGGDKAIVGGADGVLTLWDRGHWDDQVQRILLKKAVGGSESVDALMLLPEDVSPGHGRRHIAAGMGDGSVSIVSLFPHAVVCRLDHDDLEAITGLGVDCSGRLFTGGGQNIKIWIRRETSGVQNDDDEDEFDDDDDDDDDDDEGDSDASDKRARKTKLNGTAVRPVDTATDATTSPAGGDSGRPKPAVKTAIPPVADDSDDDNGGEDSDEDVDGSARQEKKRRNRKRKRGKAGQPAMAVKRRASVTFHGID